MKPLHKTVFVVYLLALLWLILFKFSYDISGVIANFQSRNFNLVPLVGLGQGNTRGMIDNCLVFLPLGLLLGVNCKQITFWRKLAFAFLLSLGAEVAQFVMAIGAADIDDVIMNTLGGFIGLALYGLVRKYIDSKRLDLCITAVIAMILILITVLRVFVLKVRY